MNQTLSSNCTSFLVGREMSEDGSFMAARSEDWDFQYAKHFEFHPAQETGPAEFVAKDSPFHCPLPPKALAYTALAPYHLPGHWGSAGFNSAGVGMSATETIFSSAKALAADPEVETGVGENCIYNITIPYIHTAREGVQRVGALIEKYGVCEGFGISFVDAHEMWYLETAGGHRWLATRIPDEAYFASGNQSRFRHFDPGDKEHYMAAPDLIEFAREMGLYDPKEGPFDFHKAYARDEQEDTTYNYPRVWYIQSAFNPELEQKVEKNTFPVFAKAEKKLSLNDVKHVFRMHYNGTEHDPYLHKNPKEPFRPISIFRTTQIHILQVRPELPMAIGRINYVALGMGSLSLFLPYYQGLDALPESYRIGDNTFSDESVYWQYRKVQTLAMVDYNRYAPIVQNAYAIFEADLALKQQQMENAFLSLNETDPLKAKALINEFTLQMMEEAHRLNLSLVNELFTQLATDIQTKYLFHGA